MENERQAIRCPHCGEVLNEAEARAIYSAVMRSFLKGSGSDRKAEACRRNLEKAAAVRAERAAARRAERERVKAERDAERERTREALGGRVPLRFRGRAENV